MTISDRDRKILIVIVPLVVVLGYWFLLLAPKREAATTAATELAKQEQRLDAAKQRDTKLGSAKGGFAADYAELVRLGKAIPSSVDMPSLIVQLEGAADGTGIRFTRMATGDRKPPAAPAPAPAAPGEGDGSQPAAPGGTPAQSGTGQATEKAGENVTAANDKSQGAEAAANSGVSPADAQTSTPAGASGQPAAAGGAPGLDTVPLEMEFQGGFFDLADFFHRLKRFVRLARGEQIQVRGRLLTIDSLKFSSDPEIFPRLKAEIKATVYLAPKAEGSTAGATPQGPGAVPASAPATAAPSATPPAATATPTAAATP